MAEAVTSGVSARPTVGSDFQTGLCTAVGMRDRCSLSSGDYSDKVDHVAGRSVARFRWNIGHFSVQLIMLCPPGYDRWLSRPVNSSSQTGSSGYALTRRERPAGHTQKVIYP